jgi:hypothetical protein
MQMLEYLPVLRYLGLALPNSYALRFEPLSRGFEESASWERRALKGSAAEFFYSGYVQDCLEHMRVDEILPVVQTQDTNQADSHENAEDDLCA